MVFASDLLESGQANMVWLTLPIGKVAGLFIHTDLSHNFFHSHLFTKLAISMDLF
jgi:hypothetical protein